MSSDEIRETFLRYFEERGHKRVKSSSLVPKDDPTLLFTNAGMNQFKDIFLGLETREYKRAVSSQKCMRVSGKHNDLEMVGRTPRHHTFFEMLGNFSFGDYFKREAIRFAWELCTDVYRLDKELLIVTVFEEDDEAYQIWRDEIGVSPERLRRCGEAENFWAMGETGPCGPCSEIHFDLGPRIGDTESPFEADSDRFVEIWNLVFMQYNRDQLGRLTPLPSPSIDTGMGLERIACVLQGVSSNYDTDLFRPLLEEASRLTSTPYGESEESDTSLRILADHSRACMFLINDGVAPGNEGRGYVLRKILRRAVRHGKLLGQDEPFIYTLVSLVAEIMSSAYPELEKSREYAATIVRNEEARFSATLDHGLQLLNEVFEDLEKKQEHRVPGGELFRLYDTYGFPLDMAREIAEERGFEIDEAGFRAELEQQRQRARASWKGVEKSVQPILQELARRDFKTEFTGYEQIEEVPGSILAILYEGQEVDSLAAGQKGEVVLDRTPFYAEAGGQVSDTGIIETDTAQAEVLHVYTPVSGLRLHQVVVKQGQLKKGDRVFSSVESDRRQRTALNHTATHLLHAALREVLGEHVKQAGSLVAPDRLRFDFTHYQPLTTSELAELEEIVNAKIRENIRLKTEISDLEEAIASGAMALFGEKYDEKVRVVTIPGFSKELCGGTHVRQTGEIAVFKIISESSISAGVRRIEAITGPVAVSRFREDEELLRELSADLHASREELPRVVERLSQELKQLNKKVEDLQLKVAQQAGADPDQDTREIAGVRVLARRVENVDRNALRQLADQLKNKLRSGVVVLGTPSNGKVSLVAMVSDDLTDRIRADELLRGIAPIVSGGGGGKPTMAEAGGKNPATLDEALAETYRVVEKMLSS
ncbi:MAG TPA: alanine--tRNA ligase [Acidobacteriota bacterium]|nr:alanine--tRNA ligase [Acidobacteriota bacterium]